MITNKTMIKEKIQLINKALEAIKNNNVTTLTRDTIVDLLLDYKKKLITRDKANQKLSKEKRNEYMRKYRKRLKDAYANPNTIDDEEEFDIFS